jgi:membrane associated rhomboid family serine protease
VYRSTTEDELADSSFHYSILIKRVVTGLILGTLAGAIQVWFFERDLMYLWASAAAGGLYMAAWVLFTDWLRLAGGKVLLGAVAGLFAAVVWWAIAVHVENMFIQSAVAGLCFGAAYAWSDQRTP